jgi:hypothetical protein
MSVQLRWAAAIAAVGVATALAAAPIANARGADAVINNLQAEGLIVNINWVNGFNTQQLSDCTVVNVNNPDSSGAPLKAGDTVYVDVRCPNHPDEGDVSIGVGTGGIGIGIG